MKFTEAKLEQAIIELLGAEGYPHVLGETIERQSQEVLIKADLRAFLSKQYAKDGITSGEIESVIKKLESFSSADLYESNKAIMKMVSDGFLLKRERYPHPRPLSQGEKGVSQDESSGRSGDEGRSQHDLYIQLIDYSALAQFREPKPGEVPMVVAEEHPVYQAGGNIFKMVNQLEITGSHLRIPDGILYINGLPLVVFEFKSAIREEATIHDAFIQLTVRYKRDIPELFKYNAFCVLSDGVNSKVGSFFAPYEFFYAWRRSGPHLNPLPGGEDLNSPQYRGGFTYSGLTDRARELRQKQTPAEEVMWELVRNRRVAGLKFRRQHQIGPYIVDFFCNENKLVVELDGGVHESEDQKKHDHKRDAYLRSLGFTVLRFDNDVFLNDPESILKKVVAHGGSSPSGRGGGEGALLRGEGALLRGRVLCLEVRVLRLGVRVLRIRALTETRKA